MTTTVTGQLVVNVPVGETGAFDTALIAAVQSLGSATNVTATLSDVMTPVMAGMVQVTANFSGTLMPTDLGKMLTAVVAAIPADGVYISSSLTSP